MSLPRDDQATGRLRLVAMALRGLTLLACVGRRQRAAEGAKLAGREAGNPRRETARPTAERLREAFEGLPLTVVVKGCQQTDRHITTLSPLPQRFLEILGFSLALYTRLCTVSSEPPEKWANRKIVLWGTSRRARGITEAKPMAAHVMTKRLVMKKI